MQLNYTKKDIKIIFTNLFSSQRPKPAVRRRSSVLDHICVSLSVGSVTETKTVLMELTRVSKLAAVSDGWGLKTYINKRRNPYDTYRSFYLIHLSFFFYSFLSVQQHMQQQRVHVPEPTVYPQTLCVWPRHRLQRWLGRVPRVWWVGPWPLIPDSDWGI